MTRLFARVCLIAVWALTCAGMAADLTVDARSNLLPWATTRITIRRETPAGDVCAVSGGEAAAAAVLEKLGTGAPAAVDVECPGDAPRTVLYRVLPAPGQTRLSQLMAAPMSTVVGDLPEAVYLHDIAGRRIPASGGGWRLNLTRPEAAAVVARAAYDAMVAARLEPDGVWFETAPPRMSLDAEGKRVVPDTDEDGRADFLERLEPDWARGVERAAAEWRKLMPHAYFVAGTLNASAIAAGSAVFSSAWRAFAESPQSAGICVVSSTPAGQIVSGYGERPAEQAPPATVDFARASYRAMRFGLGLALLGGCQARFDLGQAGRAVRWAYDEAGFDLGEALGPAEVVSAAAAAVGASNRLANASFEEPLDGTWTLYNEARSGVLAWVERDGAAKADGAWSARVTIAEAGGGVPWHVNLFQSNVAIRGGVTYDLEFRARADAPRTMGLAAQKSSPDWRNYGLWDSVELGTAWRKYTVSFIAPETAADGQLQFLLGGRKGVIWLDGVTLTEHPPDLLRRRFSKGMVVVNASAQANTIALDADGYRRFQGAQAPRVDTILDDAAEGFSTGSGGAVWEWLRIDSGEWEALGPFYHHWGKGLRQSADPGATAEWAVSGLDGSFTFSAWWPAAPYRGNWTRAAVYELIRDGVVVASKAVDQSSEGGDQWLPLFTAELSGNPQARWRVRVRNNQGEGLLTVDAVRVVSAAGRWNDGAAVTGRAVELGPFDALLLAR